MSLLDEAREHQARVKPCVLARAVKATWDEDRWDEVGELLRAEDIAAPEVIATLGIVGKVSDRSVTDKRRTGCRCVWCRQYWSEA